MTKEALKQILIDHKKWLNKEEGGKRAILKGEDLSFVNLINVDLRLADLRSTCFYNAKLEGVNFSYAELKNANFRFANIIYSNFENSDLTNVKFEGTIMKRSNVRHSNIKKTNIRSLKFIQLIYD